MNLAHKAIVFMLGVTFIIAALLFFLRIDLQTVDFLILGAMIFIPTFLYFYIFSAAGKNPTKKRTKNVPLNPLANKNAVKLDNLVQMTQHRLYKLSSVYPFDLFPDHIFIEQKQILIIYGQFFASNQDYNILIKDILIPVVENSIFFSTLKIEVGPGGRQQNPPPVPFLKKSEALKAKRIIMGLIICDRDGIDLSAISPEEIVKKVEEIGRTKID